MTGVSKYRVVIDTNLLISAIIVSGSMPDQLIRLWRDDRYSLITTHEIVEELTDVCNREIFKTTYSLFLERSSELINNLKLSAELVTPIPETEMLIHCRDPKDDKLLACALGGHATHLITGDKDLLVLKEKAKLNHLTILTVNEFLDLHKY